MGRGSKATGEEDEYTLFGWLRDWDSSCNCDRGEGGYISTIGKLDLLSVLVVFCRVVGVVVVVLINVEAFEVGFVCGRFRCRSL